MGVSWISTNVASVDCIMGHGLFAGFDPRAMDWVYMTSEVWPKIPEQMIQAHIHDQAPAQPHLEGCSWVLKTKSLVFCAYTGFGFNA